MKKSLITGIIILLVAASIIGYLIGGQNSQEKISGDKGKISGSGSLLPSSQGQKNSYESGEKQTAENQNSQSSKASGCKGTGIVNFTFPPRRLTDIGFIEPTGLMLGNHVTPIDHGYFYPVTWKQNPSLSDLTDVLAPADGVITDIQRMPTYFSSNNPDFEDYRIILSYTCTFYTIYIHIYKLSPKIKDTIGELAPSQDKNPNIPVSAGELIGRAYAFDFSLHDEQKTLKGFIVPEHYNQEPWKIHTVDFFDYFIEPLRSQLLAKNLRAFQPYGGKIDYDIDGTLSGNWFVEDTNGYAGIKQPEYWVTHASFSPDALDNEHYIVSLGDFNGEPKQFGIKGNSPKPSDVTPVSGIIKYELTDFEYAIGDTSNYWNRNNFAQNLKARNIEQQIKGVVLIQLLEKRKLKLEEFPGKISSEVSSFTSNAKIYER